MKSYCIVCTEELKEHEGRICMHCVPLNPIIMYRKDETNTP